MTICARPRCDLIVKRGYDHCHRHLYSEGIFKPRVPVAPVRAHLRRCIEQGATIGGIATATGVAYVTARGAAGLNSYQDQSHIARDIADKLKGARPDMIGHWIPAWPYQRRIQALRAAGHTVATIAEQCSLSQCAVSDISNCIWDTIGTPTAERIAAAYETMSALPVTTISPQTLTRGWSPPMLWDNIDDPHEDHTPPPGTVHACGPVLAAIRSLNTTYGVQGTPKHTGVSRETLHNMVTGRRIHTTKATALAVLRAAARLARQQAAGQAA